MYPIRQRFIAEAPSNIALVKYWGKKDPERQWPAGPSLSMTLDKAITRTAASQIDDGRDQFVLGGQVWSSTDPRRIKSVDFLDHLRKTLGFSAALHIETENTFPESCGMASSASGFAALTLAAVAAWTNSHSFEDLNVRGFSRERLAGLARMGSGSACRSFWGGFVSWEPGPSFESQVVQPIFPHDHWELVDCVLIPSREPKKVPSSAGHVGAWSSPLFKPRLMGLAEKMDAFTEAIKHRDLPLLGMLLEAEALEMHAVMMTADQPIRYLGERTLQILAWIRQSRNAGELHGYFTLDAGQTVHLLMEKDGSESAIEFIRQAHPDLEIIVDQVGTGPILKTESLS